MPSDLSGQPRLWSVGGASHFGVFVWGFIFSWLCRGNRGGGNLAVHPMELGVLVET